MKKQENKEDGQTENEEDEQDIRYLVEQ